MRCNASGAVIRKKHSLFFRLLFAFILEGKARKFVQEGVGDEKIGALAMKQGFFYFAIACRKLTATRRAVFLLYSIEALKLFAECDDMEQSDTSLPTLLAIDLDRYFHQLVQAYQPRLYTFVSRQGSSPHDAEDIVQEALIRAYYALGDYPEERVRALKLQPWLYKITLNEFYNPAHRSRLQCVPLDLSEESALLEVEDDGREQPDVIVEETERLRELEALVTRLPGQYREAVNLYYFEDMTYQEIAEMLGQPLGTVKSNVHRGIRLLRKALETQKSR